MGIFTKIFHSALSTQAIAHAANMGQPSFEASNAIIYLTYGSFLIMGTLIAWRMRERKADFLSANRTQTAFPLALNFIASGE